MNGLRKITLFALLTAMLLTGTSCRQAEPEPCYTVTYDKFLYSYRIQDRQGNLLAEDTTSRQPHISQETEDIVCLWIQTGTGTSTRWSQYFNIRTGEISPVYYGQTDSFGTMTSNTGSGCVIVSDMFTGEEIMTVDEWGQPLGECVENIRSAYFSEDGKSLEVICLDTDFEEFHVTVPIP